MKIRHGRYVLDFKGGFAFWDTTDNCGRVIYYNGHADDITLPKDRALARKILTEGKWTTGAVQAIAERSE